MAIMALRVRSDGDDANLGRRLGTSSSKESVSDKRNEK